MGCAVPVRPASRTRPSSVWLSIRTVHALVGDRCGDSVALVHRQEGRDVELLVDTSLRAWIFEHVRVLSVPRCARDVRDERLDGAVPCIPAPKAGDRVEEPSPGAEVGEHADRALPAGLLSVARPDRGSPLRAAAAGGRRSRSDETGLRSLGDSTTADGASRPRRPRRGRAAGALRVREFVANRPHASVKDGAFEDRTLHERTPSSAQTRCAAATPSSWKPYPQ